MKTSISENDICKYFALQLNNFFPDSETVNEQDLKRIISVTFDRLDFCFKHVVFKRYNSEGERLYNHLYADHNILFIWMLSNNAYKVSENINLSAKLYYLNKTLHSFDCMYDTELPNIFLVFHGAGTMLGKAKYSDFFVALQGCTIGSQKGAYPVLGKGVALTAHSGLIGDCKVGDRATISAFNCLIDTDVPADHAVYRGTEGKIQMKKSKECYAQQFFNINI